jgi:hypothetical protein
LGLDSPFIETSLRPIVRVLIFVHLFVPIGRALAIALSVVHALSARDNFFIPHSLGFLHKICVCFVINFLGGGNRGALRGSPVFDVPVLIDAECLVVPS